MNCRRYRRNRRGEEEERDKRSERPLRRGPVRFASPTVYTYDGSGADFDRFRRGTR